MADAGEELDQLVARFEKLPRPVRIVYARPRTFVAMAIGVVAFLLLPSHFRLVTRLLIGWDIFIAAYLILVVTMMVRCDRSNIRRNAILQDDGTDRKSVV